MIQTSVNTKIISGRKDPDWISIGHQTCIIDDMCDTQDKAEETGNARAEFTSTCSVTKSNIEKNKPERLDNMHLQCRFSNASQFENLVCIFALMWHWSKIRHYQTPSGEGVVLNPYFPSWPGGLQIPRQTDCNPTRILRLSLKKGEPKGVTNPRNAEFWEK